MRADTPR